MMVTQQIPLPPNVFASLNDHPISVLFIDRTAYPFGFAVDQCLTLAERDDTQLSDEAFDGNVPRPIRRMAEQRANTGRTCRVKILALLDQNRYIRPGYLGLVVAPDRS